MQATFILLGVAIIAVWLPEVRLGRRATFAPWTLLFCAATATGYSTGILSLQALAAIAAFAIVTGLSQASKSAWMFALFTSCSVAMALASGLHLIPGFLSPALYDGFRFRDASIPFTQFLNFDNATAGFFLPAAFSPKISDAADFRRSFKPSVLIVMLATPAVVLCTAWVTGSVEWDSKLPPMAFSFLAVKLLFACAAEKAFFRGFLQERLSRIAGQRTAWQAAPVVFPAVCIGAAHIGKGVPFMMLAAIAGLGYSVAYALSRRIEAAIPVHFGLNAAHLLLFSYPLAER